MLRNLQELYQYRALLYSLTQRELKARYRGSLLGFLWTFLNPTLYMLVYALVFNFVSKNTMEHYTYFMFVGLLPWMWFSSSVVGGASSISDRRDLLTKVRFPAQVLPATVIATNLANYIFSLPLMVGMGLIVGVLPTWHSVAFPLVVLVQLMFTLGLTYLISALNVTFRDLQHIITNLMTLWFFVTPVLYPATTVPPAIRGLLTTLNPMAALSQAYQDIFYLHQLPDFAHLGGVALASLLLLGLSARVFERRSEEFAELA
jgi:homopolymeric O-antigen transport system permease protein